MGAPCNWWSKWQRAHVPWLSPIDMVSRHKGLARTSTGSGSPRWDEILSKCGHGKKQTAMMGRNKEQQFLALFCPVPPRFLLLLVMPIHTMHFHMWHQNLSWSVAKPKGNRHMHCTEVYFGAKRNPMILLRFSIIHANWNESTDSPTWATSPSLV